LSHVTHDIFNPFRRTTLFSWGLLIANIISVIVYKKSIMDEPLMYLIIDIVTFASLIHFIYNVINELKQILGLNLLTLT
jgi:hypothetical protein